MRVKILYVMIAVLSTAITVLVISNAGRAEVKRGSVKLGPPAQSHAHSDKLRNFDAQIAANASESLADGRDTFRFDTFGDEVFGATRSSFTRRLKERVLAV